jgi:hypothetical protein
MSILEHSWSIHRVSVVVVEVIWRACPSLDGCEEMDE